METWATIASLIAVLPLVLVALAGVGRQSQQQELRVRDDKVRRKWIR